MNKFEKKWANKKTRREEPKAIKANDVPALKKKGGKKACPGWISHEGKPKTPLTVPCQTCKRKFCSTDCHENHRHICEAKFVNYETGDIQPLIEVAKKTYDFYIDNEAHVKKEHWSEEDKKDGRVSFMFKWDHGDLEEAMKILKKHDIQSLRKPHRTNYMWL